MTGEVEFRVRESHGRDFPYRLIARGACIATFRSRADADLLADIFNGKTRPVIRRTSEPKQTEGDE